jgi:hypothetical protein
VQANPQTRRVTFTSTLNTLYGTTTINSEA